MCCLLLLFISFCFAHLFYILMSKYYFKVISVQCTSCVNLYLLSTVDIRVKCSTRRRSTGCRSTAGRSRCPWTRRGCSARRCSLCRVLLQGTSWCSARTASQVTSTRPTLLPGCEDPSRSPRMNGLLCLGGQFDECLLVFMWTNSDERKREGGGCDVKKGRTTRLISRAGGRESEDAGQAGLSYIVHEFLNSRTTHRDVQIYS